MTTTTIERQALILFAHGARDPAWAAPFERLRALCQGAMPGVGVRLAFLELMQPDLASAASEEVAAGATRLTIVPVFLGQGGHVRRDLPRLLDALRLAHPAVQIEATPAAGEDDAVLQAIAAYCLQATRA